MDQGKQIQEQLYNKNTRVLPKLEQSQKVEVAQSTKADHIVLRLYMVEFTPGTGDS